MTRENHTRSKRLACEQLECRLMLAIDTYFINLNGSGSVDIFGADGGGSVQQEFVNHPLSIGTLIQTNNVPDQNNRPPVAGSTTFPLSPGDDQLEVGIAAPGVLVNAIDPDGGIVSLQSFEALSDLGAIVDINPDGSFTYDPRNSAIVRGLESGETIDDTIHYILADDQGLTSAVSALIQVVGTNDPPTLVHNLGGSLIEGDVGVISAGELAANDPDDEASDLVYTVTAGPTQGQLELATAPGTPITSFTQLDIDSGLVLYVHSGAEITTDSFDFSLSDDGEDGVVPLTETFSFSITSVDDPPINSGTLPTTVTAVEDVASQVDLSSVTLADPDSALLTLTIESGGGTLAATNGGGVTVSGTGTTSLSLTGSPANLNTYLATTSNIQYTGLTNIAGAGADTLEISVTDGQSQVALSPVDIDIIAVNDAPINSGTIPTDLAVTEDIAGNLDLGDVSLFDADGDQLTLTISALGGTFNATSANGVVASGSGTASLSLSGDAANINSFLDLASNIQFTGADNVSGIGVDTISLEVNDGNPPIALGSFGVDIAAVNDAPSNAGSLPANVSALEDVPGEVDLSGLDLVDLDGDVLSLDLSATSGILIATGGGGVAVSGSGTSSLTLSGSPINLNSFLDTITGIQYTSALNASGTAADTISVSLSDAETTISLGDVDVDITAVDDLPTNTGSLPTDMSLVEDTLGNFDLSVVELLDPDSGSLTLLLSADVGIFSASSAGGVTVSGSGTSALSLMGTDAQINAYLDSISNVGYLGPADLAGNDVATISLSVSDGGAPVALGDVNVDITAVDDPPSNLGSMPTDIDATEDLPSDVDLSELLLSEPDDEVITLTITAGSGSLLATSGGSVTAAGSTTNTLTLTGLPGDLNTYLDSSSNIRYVGALHVAGDDIDSLSVEIEDGTTLISLGTIDVDLSAVNDDPTNAGSLPTTLAAVEDTLTDLNLSGISIADVDAGTSDLTVTLMADTGILQVVVDASIDTTGNGTNMVTLTGTLAELNAYLAVSTNVGYLGALNLTGDDAASIEVIVNDGGNTGTGGGSDILFGTIDVDLSAVNDDPTNAGSLPTTLAAVEDTLTDLNLSGISIADVDAGTSDLTVTLMADTGILQVVVDASIDTTGNGTNMVTLTGTLAELNAYLAVSTNVGYLGALNLTGDDAASIKVIVNDGGNTGTGGGSDILFGTIDVDLSAVNDDPTNAGALPTTLAAVEDTLTDLNLSGISIADVDAGTSDLTVTLMADTGILQVVVDASIDTTGNGTNMVTLTGTLAELNAYLAVSTNVGYLGALNLTGDDAASIKVIVNDGGNTGTGGGSDILFGTIDVDLSAVNDDPTNAGALPTDLSVITGLLSGIDLSQIDIADVDSASGLVTVTLSAGLSDLSATDGGGVTVAGSDTDTLSLTGTITNLNAFIDVTTNIGFFPGAGLLGEDVDLLSISVNDGGNTGSGGGGDVALGNINIDVLPAGPLTAAITTQDNPRPAKKLAEQQLESAVDLALSQLSLAGLPESDLNELQTTQYKLVNLPNDFLGIADTQTNTVWIDEDGAGRGYSITEEPLSINFWDEFENYLLPELYPSEDGAYDLMSVVFHEMGHLLGHNHHVPRHE